MAPVIYLGTHAMAWLYAGAHLNVVRRADSCINPFRVPL